MSCFRMGYGTVRQPAADALGVDIAFAHDDTPSVVGEDLR